MSRPRRLNILVVPSDGSSPRRFHLPRWILRAVSGAGVVLLVTTALAVADYVRLRRFSAESAALYASLAEQQALLESTQRRIGEIRREVDTWRELQARIWEPFGPEAGRVRPTTGVGGPRTVSPEEGPGPRPSAIETERLAQAIAEQGKSLRALERLMVRAGKVLALTPSRWPVRGAVNSEFGQRNSPWTGTAEMHRGIDIGAALGTAVHAPASGRVVLAESQGELGLTVILEHSPDLRSVYGHLSKTLVASGQQVERNQVLGLTGNSGLSSGPHLHYEILDRRKSVDPRAYLWD